MGNHEYPCPSCGFFTTGEVRFHSFNICPLCNWEDDGVQLANPACNGGANRGSLIEYQRESMKAYPFEIHVIGKYKRDPNWRSLSNQEITQVEAEKKRKSLEE
jgi:hypothetical protein